MPPHFAVYENGGAAPAEPITVSQEGGEDSGAIVREIWNDKDGAFLDTTTGDNLAIKLLASGVIGFVDDEPVYGPYRDSGVAILDERWFTIRATAILTADGETAIDTGSLPFGTNATFHIDDIPPETGIRIELRARTPGAQSFANAVKLQLGIDDNSASSPLAALTSLATGSAIIPADRIPGERALLRGSEVTADDSDTVTLSPGAMAYDGTVIALVADAATFDLEDADAVELDAGEDYRVTLSRSPVGALVVTKSVKLAASAPATPAGNVFVRSLVVESADGVAVTVSAGSLTGTPSYAECYVRAGAGLSVIVSRGRSISATDHQQRVSHDLVVGLPASQTSRIWINPDGSAVDTLTDAEPVVGSQLIALAVTDTDSVTEVIDMRRFAHRALTEWHPEVRYEGALSQISTDDAFDMLYLYDDAEIEGVELNATAMSGLLTAGELRIDVVTFAPGAAVPFPNGGAGGTSIFDDAATDAPALAFDAASLRVVVRDHIVRRLVKGTRVLFRAVSTVTASAPEEAQQIRVALHARRYR